jgi:hypothetical protein
MIRDILIAGTGGLLTLIAWEILRRAFASYKPNAKKILTVTKQIIVITVLFIIPLCFIFYYCFLDSRPVSKMLVFVIGFQYMILSSSICLSITLWMYKIIINRINVHAKLMVEISEMSERSLGATEDHLALSKDIIGIIKQQSGLANPDTEEKID